MPTRFSDADYFVTTPFQGLETLAFLQLPVPQVSPSPPTSTFSDLLFRCFSSVVDVSLGIEKFPVETSLSKFFSDVLPQKIEFGAEDFDDGGPFVSGENFVSRDCETESSEETKVLNEENELGNQRNSGSKAIRIEVTKKSNGSVIDDKVAQRYEITQFETPELDTFMDHALLFEKEGIQILSRAPEIEEHLDMLKPGLSSQYPCEVKSIISVEKIAFECPVGKNDNLQDDCSFQDQIHYNQITFPVVEVDEIILEEIEGFSMEKKLLSVFEYIELEHPQRNNLDIGDKELLGAKEYDVSGCLYNDYLSFLPFGSEVESLDNLSEVDMISLVEISQNKINSGSQGTLNCDCFLSDKPVVYEEFHILDMDSSQNFEALLNHQMTCEPETCDWMFNEDMNFKDFNQLIVSHELTLVDDSFKSLPVPVICDDEKLRSIYAIIEGKLANLRPHPLSALDGIYLDWHLLEENKYSNAYYCENILKDVGSQSINYDWDSFGDRNAVDDFGLSDDHLYGFIMDDNGEPKEFLSDVSIPTSIGVAVGSSSELPQADNEERMAKKNSGRSSLLFKSNPQSIDLDFFLNAQKPTVQRHSEPAIRAVNNKAISPKSSLGDSVAATSQGGEAITISDTEESVNKQKQLFYYLSTTEEYDMGAKDATNRVDANSMPFPSMPYVKDSNDGTVSFPQTVIVVNTQTLDKEMIVSRRSTYQRILALEKEGAQVVERDSDLPVDIIVNSATCLVWYDCGNIGKKATDSNEASSCLPLCIENIATNVLILLSFSFSRCIMVFEGDDSFLSTVMESSEGFYAAAASLGVDMQLFCSYSSELTEEVIMSSIANAPRGVYPRMLESETIAEFFLNKFPSANPLTAHAILSLGATIAEFLGWSDEHRICALQKYNVPDESIILLGASCKFGEREDSRSIMTDCSSSVSSGTDSKNFNINVSSKRKRWEYDGTRHKSDTYMDDLLHIDPVNQFSEDSPNPSSLKAKQYDKFMSRISETFHEFRKPGLCGSNLFHQEQGLDVSVMMDPSIAPKPHDFQMSKEPQMLKMIRKPQLSMNDFQMSKEPHGTDVAMLKNFDLHCINSSEFMFEDEKGEVIDLTGSPGSGKGFSSIADPISFLMPDMEKDATRKSRTARRLLFGKNRKTTFPTSVELFSGENIWNSLEDKRHILQGVNGNSDMDRGDDVSFFRHPDKLVEDCFKPRPAEKSHRLQFQEDSSYFESGGTLLSNALSFSTPGKKTPWTKDFLDRIREKCKSKLRSQSLPCDSPAPCFGGVRSTSKVTKRRSPSILEFFKYQGGSTTRRIPEQKKQKQSMQSSSSAKDVQTSASASILRTWTPIDKRSRQTLSFALNNEESQTKLVWNEGTPNCRKKFQKQL